MSSQTPSDDAWFFRNQPTKARCVAKRRESGCDVIASGIAGVYVPQMPSR
jgi:hypothetical protein